MRFDPETHTVHANGRTWRADPASTQVDDLTFGDAGKYVHRTRRCMIRFESGWAASITWGDHSYSSNHDVWRPDDPFTEEPATVEVGVIDHTGMLRMRHKTDDDMEWHEVESYVDDAELVVLLDRLATLPTGHDYGIRPPTIAELRASYDELREATEATGHPLPPWPT